jgi:hypothetical protein
MQGRPRKNPLPNPNTAPEKEVGLEKFQRLFQLPQKNVEDQRRIMNDVSRNYTQELEIIVFVW